MNHLFSTLSADYFVRLLQTDTTNYVNFAFLVPNQCAFLGISGRADAKSPLPVSVCAIPSI